MSALRTATPIVASSDQVSCDLAGEAAVLNLTTGIYFGLNRVGAAVWQLLQRPTTFGAVREAMLERFEVAPATLDADLEALIGQLADHGLVTLGE